MKVFEIFRSIQGESTWAGLPMHFVRLAGCDLACTYCDTPQARDPAAGREMTVAEVVAALRQKPLPWVAITGGEPALQAQSVNALIAALLDDGRTVLIETNGAHPLGLLDDRAVRIIDVKTPGSGMVDRMVWENLARLGPRDEVKFVITSRADYEWSRQVLKRHKLTQAVTVLLSPAAPTLDPKVLARWIVEDGLPVRLNLQLHKYLHLP